MVEIYWNIGKKIIDGQRLLQELSKQMTKDFGKGFIVVNLKNMRQFYLTFSSGWALHSKLSWTV